MSALDKRVNLRLFPHIWEKVVYTTQNAKDDQNRKKYENESHFMRCGVMKLIREEERKL